MGRTYLTEVDQRNLRSWSAKDQRITHNNLVCTILLDCALNQWRKPRTWSWIWRTAEQNSIILIDSLFYAIVYYRWKSRVKLMPFSILICEVCEDKQPKVPCTNATWWVVDDFHARQSSRWVNLPRVSCWVEATCKLCTWSAVVVSRFTKARLVLRSCQT